MFVTVPPPLTPSRYGKNGQIWAKKYVANFFKFIHQATIKKFKLNPFESHLYRGIQNVYTKCSVLKHFYFFT